VTGSPLDDESIPRDKGELVFEAPWQARALAVAVALVEKLGLPWDVFRHRLIDAMPRIHNVPTTRAGAAHWSRWSSNWN